MNPDVDVIALCGSHRDDSKTRIACRMALDAATEAGAETTLVDLREYDLPPLEPDAGAAGDAARLLAVVDEADAAVLGTPNYHGSYSGVLKNALDYLGRDEFEGTTVGLLEVAGGSYPGPAMAHLRAVCRTLNAWTLPLEVGVPRSHERVSPEGIVEESSRRRVRRLGREVTAYGGVAEYPAVAGGPKPAAAED